MTSERPQEFNHTRLPTEFNPDYLTGEDDFAILSDASQSFLKTIFEYPNITTHLKNLFHDVNINIRHINIFSIDAPINICLAAKIDVVSEQLVRRKIDQLYAVLGLLSGYKAKSKQKFFSSNGVCLNIIMIMSGRLPCTFLMMHEQRHWLVFDENLWWVATLIGLVVALLICTALLGLLSVG